MFDLTSFALSDMVACSAGMRAAVDGAQSMEAAAAAIVSYLGGVLVDKAAAEPSCVLVRIFVTQPLRRLPGPLQRQVRSKVAARVGDEVRCLTLLASAGVEPDWNDRAKSANHGVIPIESAAALDRAPMLSALVRQLGVDPRTLLEAAGEPVAAPVLRHQSFDVFHVQHARRSGLVPDQDFVERYAVKSVLGCGGLLPTGDMAALVMFSRTPISRATADLFRTVGLNIRLALLPFAEGPIFAPTAAEEEPVPPVAGRAHPRAAMLEEMLEILEDTVQRQALRLEGTVAELVTSQATLRESEVRLREEAELVETLHEVGTLLTSELSLDRVVQAVTDAATRLTGADLAAFLYTVDRPGGAPQSLFTLAGPRAERFGAFPVARGAAAPIPSFDGAGTLRSADITSDAAYAEGSPFAHLSGAPSDVRSYLAVEVVARSGHQLGALLFGHRDAEVFDQRTERVAKGVAAQAAVAIENARLYEQRSETARMLQRSLLPPHILAIPGVDIAVRYHPLVGDIGGDFYDVFRAGDDRWGLTLGDVCGKGIGAASLTALARYTLRAGILSEPGVAGALRLLNRAVAEDVTDERFCTAIAATLQCDADGATVTVARAGHPAPIMVYADGRLAEIGEAGAPAGLFDDIGATESTLRMAPGETLVLYTDGVTELADPSVDGVALLFKVVAANAKRSAEEIASAIERVIMTAVGGAPRDDVALLVVRIRDEEVTRGGDREWRVDEFVEVAPPMPASIPVLRTQLLHWLAAQELHQHDVAAIASAVVEAATNAVRHARTGVQLRAWREPGVVVFEVSDDGSGFDRKGTRSEGSVPHVLAEHGRGLAMIETLTDDLTISSSRDGTVVRARRILTT